MMADPTVLINIVLYNPDKDKVLELIRICSQYEQAKILLFDNVPGTPCFLECAHSEKIVLYKSEKNVGIAGSHYYACKMAENENFDFVLFLDQDSLLPESFINAMLSGFYTLQKKYPRLSAVGPSWQDPRIHQWYQNKKIKNNLRNKLKQKLKKKLKVTQRREKIFKLLRLDNIVISSGMLIWVPTLKKIGYPKREYFIDLVDIEWCLRALLKNYQVETLKDIKMKHTIGEFKVSKNNFLQYQNSIRYYYTLRNSLFLFKERQYPLNFRTFILMRNIFEIKKIPFVPEPKKSLIAAIRGIKDGLLSKPTILN